MLALHDRKHYTTQEVLMISRAVSKQLSVDPFAFQEQGVFRISGDHQNVMQIISDILKHKDFVKSQYTIHDYVGALKYALTNGELLSKQDPSVNALRESAITQDLALGLEGVNQFIQELAQSDDRVKFMVAEVLYEYLHLLSNALIFQLKNKMNQQNLGIIAGPFLANFVEEEPVELINVTLKLNQISAQMLIEGYFQDSFETVFKPKVEAWREKDLTALEDERSLLLRLRDLHADKKNNFREEIAKDKEKLSEKNKRLYDDFSPGAPVQEMVVKISQLKKKNH